MPKNRMEDIKINKGIVYNNKSKQNLVESYDISDNITVLSKDPYEKKEEVDSKINKFFSKKYSHQKANQEVKIPVISKPPKSLRNSFIVLLVIVILLSGGYFLANIFEKTNINITIKRQTFSLNQKQIDLTKEEKSSVNFEIMIIEDKEIEKKTLTEVMDVSTKATGEITLYNEYSATSQKIITSTFLADEKGKTYKTDKTVTIPGYKIDSNKKIIPGKIVVGITAFLPGDIYNGSPSNFYVTAFKGKKQYQKIYGKLKTALSGGALGTVYKLNDKEKAKIDDIANTSFKTNLLKKVNAQIPPGYMLYPGAMTFSYNFKDGDLFKDQNAEIEIVGKLSAVLLKESDLSLYLLKILLPEIKKDELAQITTPELNNLSFSFSNNDQIISKDMQTVSFILSGDLKAVWNPLIDKLKIKLAGINKNDVPLIFSSDKAIDRASVQLFPPWNLYLSSNVNNININIK